MLLIFNTPVEAQFPIPVPVFGQAPYIFMFDVWHYVPIPVPIPGIDGPTITITVGPLPAPHFDVFQTTESLPSDFMAALFGALAHAVANPAAQAAAEPAPIELVGVHCFGHMIE